MFTRLHFANAGDCLHIGDNIKHNTVCKEKSP